MNILLLNAFLSGAIALGYGAICVCFFRFWRRTKVRLFQLFAVSFMLLAIERTVFALADPGNEVAPFLYSLRLVAFAVIIVAIIHQNRRSGI